MSAKNRAPKVDPATEFQSGRFYGTATSMWREGDGNLPTKYQGSIRKEVVDASYGMNGWTYNFTDDRITTGLPAYTLAELIDNAYNRFKNLRDTTSVPWFGDCAWRSSFPGVLDSGSTNPQVPWVPGASGMIQWQMDRHASARGNISFADGHAEPVPVDDLDQLLWHKKWPTDGSVVIDTNWP